MKCEMCGIRDADLISPLVNKFICNECKKKLSTHIYFNKPKQPKQQQRKIGICKNCGEEFKPRANQHYCDKCRENDEKLLKDIKYYKRKKEGKLHLTVKCEICGDEFVQKTSLQTVCGKGCRAEKNRCKSKAYRRELARKKREVEE